ncbi:hypothetical protein V491_03043 [Pseudogymnoascus sp. VKM F-3775]|nr:hypothetical protein V491_03043 [Pseudogymnoascus sp. VKM F-3775]
MRFGNPEPVEMPASNEERLEWMKSIAKGCAEPFPSLVFDISTDTEVREIILEDWPPLVTGGRDNRNGTVTLVGDAAHAMTMSAELIVAAATAASPVCVTSGIVINFPKSQIKYLIPLNPCSMNVNAMQNLVANLATSGHAPKVAAMLADVIPHPKSMPCSQMLYPTQSLLMQGR